MAGYSQKTPVHTVVFHALVFSVGGILLHAAFCTWNDICDRELDGKVGTSVDSARCGILRY